MNKTMPVLMPTLALARSAGLDAGNRSMRRSGRVDGIWTPEDVQAAHAAFMQLWERLPEKEKHYSEGISA